MGPPVETEAALAFARDRHQGILGSIRPSGFPHQANIVFALTEERTALISTRSGSAKERNLRRNPRCSLHVAGDNFWAFAVLEGKAQVSEVARDPGDAVVEELVTVFRLISGEHDDWDDYRRAMVEQQRVVLRLHIERAYGMIS
jgi:PPOX class probable F420-dependent enzyme